MKRALIIGIISSILVGRINVTDAQIKVTGHIFAEVVEVAQTSASTQNTFNLHRNSAEVNLDLGNVVFSSGKNLNCVVMINSMKAKGLNITEAGQSFSSNQAFFNVTMNQNGLYTFKIAGHADEQMLQSSSQDIKGSYEVILAFN